MLRDVVIVEAVRTPSGRRGGGLAGVHPSDLLGVVLQAVIQRAGIAASAVDQVVAGCINQSGAQSFNIARTAWLSAGLPISVPGTTVDSQCGSSQQGLGLAASLIGSGVIDVAVACGVESLSTIAIGGSTKAGPGRALAKSYFDKFEFVSQFEAGERIADKWGITRLECDMLGLSSQTRARRAWDEGRFDREIVPVDAPCIDSEGQQTGERVMLGRDQGLRETSMEALAGLRPVARPDGVHTAGSSSQLADQASAVLLVAADAAARLGLRTRARVVDHCLVGVDPVLMLAGPIDATRMLLDRNRLTADDVDVFEINEAFASVVLAWQREIKPDETRVNPNGGAIALGHALGSTGTRLVTTALHELERINGQYALISMCCGGGLATGTLIQRLDSGQPTTEGQ